MDSIPWPVRWVASKFPTGIHALCQLYLDCCYYRSELQTEITQDDQDLGRASYLPSAAQCAVLLYPIENPIKLVAGTTNTSGMRILDYARFKNSNSTDKRYTLYNIEVEICLKRHMGGDEE